MSRSLYSVLVFLLGCCIAGCGSSGSGGGGTFAGGPTATGGVGTIEVQQVLTQDQGGPSAGITHLRFTGYDESGTPRYATERLELRDVYVLENVSVTVVLLEIEYLDGFDKVGIGEVDVQVDPNEVATVINPPFQLVTLVLTNLEIRPADRTIAKATSLQFAAIATLADGAVRDLTNLVAWSSSNESVATITNLGVATGVERGTTTITGKIGALGGSTTLTVADATLETIAVNPADSELLLGRERQLEVLGTLTDTTTQDVTSQATFSSSNPDVAGVDEQGLVTAREPGETTLTATVGDLEVTTQLTVVQLSFTQQNPGVNGVFNDIVFAEGMFVVPVERLTKTTHDILLSSDGISWNLTEDVFPFAPTSITHGDGLFVVVGFDGGISTSEDGLNWTTRVSGTTNRLLDVTFGNGVFLASSQERGGPLLRSTDGVNWNTVVSTLGTLRLFESVFGNDIFVNLSEDGIYETSSDGLNWTQRNTGGGLTTTGGFFANGRFFANEFPNTITSTDGTNWTRIPGVVTDGVGTFGNGVYIDSTSANFSVISSTDGFDWNAFLVPNMITGFTGSAFANDTFVVVTNTGLIFTSP